MGEDDDGVARMQLGEVVEQPSRPAAPTSNRQWIGLSSRDRNIRSQPYAAGGPEVRLCTLHKRDEVGRLVVNGIIADRRQRAPGRPCRGNQSCSTPIMCTGALRVFRIERTGRSSAASDAVGARSPRTAKSGCGRQRVHVVHRFSAWRTSGR